MEIHNLQVEKDNKKKIELIEDKNNINWIKQFMFPSFKIKMDIRIEIIMSIIDFIKNTRFDLVESAMIFNGYDSFGNKRSMN